MEGVIPSNPLVEFILENPNYFAILFVGLLTAVLNALLIRSLQRDHKEAHCSGVVVSVLYHNAICGLSGALMILMYYGYSKKQQEETLCEINLAINVLNTVGLVSKILHLVPLHRSSKKQQALVIALIMLIAVLAFTAYSDHTSLLVAVPTSNTLTFLSLVLYIVLLVVLAPDVPEQLRNHCRSSAKPDNQSEDYKHRMIQLSFTICYLTSFLYQLLHGIATTWFPGRFENFFTLATRENEYLYILFLLDCCLDPIIYKVVTLCYKVQPDKYMQDAGI